MHEFVCKTLQEKKYWFVIKDDKGQLISERNFSVFKSPKNPTKFLTDFCPMRLVGFWGDLKTPKFRSEINWPLSSFMSNQYYFFLSSFANKFMHVKWLFVTFPQTTLSAVYSLYATFGMPAAYKVRYVQYYQRSYQRWLDKKVLGCFGQSGLHRKKTSQ